MVIQRPKLLFSHGFAIPWSRIVEIPHTGLNRQMGRQAGSRHVNSLKSPGLKVVHHFCSYRTSKNVNMWPRGKLGMSLAMCQTRIMSLLKKGWILLDSWQSLPWCPLSIVIRRFSEYPSQNLYTGTIKNIVHVTNMFSNLSCFCLRIVIMHSTFTFHNKI